MKDHANPHLKVQEHCDCHASSDPLSEMSTIEKEQDLEQAAYKYLALAVLHGVNDNAKKITIQQNLNGQIEVIAKYRAKKLPSPGETIGKRVIETIKSITHLTDGHGKSKMALGIRDSSIDLKIKLKRHDGIDQLTIKFPE
jgi:hypothetical protein